MRKFINNFLESVEFLLNENLNNFNRVFNPPTAYEELTSDFTREDKIKFDKANEMLKSGDYTEVEVKLSSGRVITLSVNYWWQKEKKGKI